MITADDDDNPPNVSPQNVPIPGLSDVHLLSQDLHKYNYTHSKRAEIGSWVMSPTYYVLVMYFCITNNPNFGGLTHHRFCGQESQIGSTGSSWLRASCKVVVELLVRTAVISRLVWGCGVGGPDFEFTVGVACRPQILTLPAPP